MSLMARTLSIFSPATRRGLELKAEVSKFAESIGFQLNPLSTITREEYFRASLCDHTVIVDASYEEGNDEIYRIVSVLPSLLDHVLIVSRTYLPLNFVPSDFGGVPKYPNALDNNTILKWLRGQLLHRRDAPPEPRLSPEELTNLVDNPSPYHKLLSSAFERRAKKGEGQRRIFLSYRGDYYDEVRRLESRILSHDFSGYESASIRIVEPGEFALDNELLSEGRRWMVMGLLDDELRATDEVWVYRTNDYLQSWWTLGELVAVAYIREGEKKSPKIRVYDPVAGNLRDDNGTYQVQLTEQHRRRLARLFSNTRPDTMGPESRKPIKWQRRIFKLGLGGLYMRLLQKALQDQDVQKATFGMLPPELARNV
jgi:hypothetical protein